MYGAGECFAFAATQDADARRARDRAPSKRCGSSARSRRAASIPRRRGFVARSILPAGGRDPNRNDSPERDVRSAQTRDRLWKSLTRAGR